MKSCFPSPENEALLQLIENQVDVEWLFHVGFDPTTLPINAPHLAIARHGMARDNETKSEKVFNEVKHHLELCTGDHELVIDG